jgi:hypothetical protein
MQVRDLIEELQKHPPEMRLELSIEAIAGETDADSYNVRRREDVIELQLCGALVRKLVEEE